MTTLKQQCGNFSLMGVSLIKRITVAVATGFITLGLVSPAVAVEDLSDLSSAVRYADESGTPIGEMITRDGDDDQFDGFDDESALVALGFPINFFGQKYESLCVDINGVVYFQGEDPDDVCDESNYDEPLEDLAEDYESPVIAALALDLVIPNDNNDPHVWVDGKTSGVYVDSTETRLIITWFRLVTYDNRLQRYPDPGDRLTFQLVLTKSQGGSEESGFDFDLEWNFGYIDTDEQRPRQQGYECGDNGDEFCWSVGWVNWDSEDEEATDVFYLLGEKTQEQLRNGGEFALVSNSLNSNIDGRYILRMSGGASITEFDGDSEEPTTDGEDSTAGTSGSVSSSRQATATTITTEPELARTGANSAALWVGTIAGGLLLMVGAGALVASRRRLAPN